MDELNQMNPDTTSDDFSIDEVNEQTSDFTDDIEGDQSEGLDVDEVTEEENAEPTSEDDFLTITYNGNQEKLTRDRAVELSQKGMNYDRLLERYNTLQQQTNSSAYKTIQDLAMKAGVSVDEYATRLNDFAKRSEIGQIVQQLKQKYTDVDPNLLTDYANQLYEQNNQKRIEQQRQEQAYIENVRKQAMLKDIEFMQREFPKQDLQHLPEEVINMMQYDQIGLKEAYLIYQNKKLTNMLNNRNKNADNKQKSVGSIAKDSGKTVADPFMAGFLE